MCIGRHITATKPAKRYVGGEPHDTVDWGLLFVSVALLTSRVDHLNYTTELFCACGICGVGSTTIIFHYCTGNIMYHVNCLLLYIRHENGKQIQCKNVIILELNYDSVNLYFYNLIKVAR